MPQDEDELAKQREKMRRDDEMIEAARTGDGRELTELLRRLGGRQR